MSDIDGHSWKDNGILAWECIVFFLFVGITTCAPLWGARGSTSAGGDAKRNYVFAGGAGVVGGVSTMAMILSVARGTLGVRSFLGYPSELVYRGSAMWETVYGMLLAFPIVAWLFVPMYLRLHTTSVYEYLELRFGGKTVRRLAAGTFILRQLLNLAVTLYTPAVALHAVLHVPHWATALTAAVAAAAFTVLGGLAAAIRADVIQTVTMIAVSVAFIAQACWRAGGPAAVLQENIDGGRLRFFTFTWDMRTRVDTLSAIIGQTFMSVSIYGCQQTFVQRYVSLGTEKRVRRTLAVTAPTVGLLFSLSWVVGCALYAVYAHCDPLARGDISAPDEILAYYVRDQYRIVPGMLGLFLASLFNGALSFLVSNVNSLATVTWEDFVSAAPAFRGINDQQQLTVIKIIGIIYTFTIAGLSMFVGSVGGVVEGSQLVTAATSGALLGAFVLAALAPKATAAGTAIALITAHLVTAALAISRFVFVDTTVPMLPTSVEGCPNATISSFSAPRVINSTVMDLLLPVTPTASPRSMGVLESIYSVSYMWYAVIGTIICLLVGTIHAYFDKSTRTYDPRLLHPMLAKYVTKKPETPPTSISVISDEKNFVLEKEKVVLSSKVVPSSSPGVQRTRF